MCHLQVVIAEHTMILLGGATGASAEGWSAEPRERRAFAAESSFSCSSMSGGLAFTFGTTLRLHNTTIPLTDDAHHTQAINSVECPVDCTQKMLISRIRVIWVSIVSHEHL